MKKNRFAKRLTLAAGLICLIATPGPVFGVGFSPNALQTPASATPALPQGHAGAAGEDDFAGLDLTDEQKAEMAKIHQGIEARRAIVAKDTTLTSDQKDAFMVGYKRQEYGERLKILTPVQQKVVRKRMDARRAADQAAHPKQPPTHPQN